MKLADFGLAAPTRGFDGEGNLKTKIGTLPFMAPEIHQANKDQEKYYEGPPVDVFASGVILFMILTQCFPFDNSRVSNSDYKKLQSNKKKA